MLKLNVLKDFLREAIKENAFIVDFTRDQTSGKILKRESNLNITYLPIVTKRDLLVLKNINKPVYVIGTNLNLKILSSIEPNLIIRFLDYRKLKS